MTPLDPARPRVGILVLNYHQPEVTTACIRRLMAREPDSSRILWIENDAARTRESCSRALRESGLPWVELAPDATALPPAGTVGVLFNPGNLGYAAGNNVGLRLLHRLGVPYAWVLNNDTELVEGTSERLVDAAGARPGIGAWGLTIEEGDHRFSGGILSREGFASRPILGAGLLESDPMAYVSGCALFLPLAWAAEAGFIPEDYFLYYEDIAFGLELRRHGHPPSAVDGVRIRHHGSLASGSRSPRVEYYTQRNRWLLIQRYFPEALEAQRWRRLYTFQKLLFRGRLDRIRIERAAYADFREGRFGPTPRTF
ncbi:MAG TPA: hypothetical protein VF768_01535 [Holophagaceae bacterium]